jgi:hypothetical protein
MTNESLDIRVAIGEANLDDLQEYEKLVAKEIKKRRSAIRRSKFDSFVNVCEQFLNDLSDEDRGKLIEFSIDYCESCNEYHVHYDTIEYTLNTLIDYFKKMQ